MSKKFLKNALYTSRMFFRHLESNYSLTTLHDYEGIVRKSLTDLHATGSTISHIKHFKPRQAVKLIGYWKTQKLSARTIKNRVAVLRFVLKKIGKHQNFPELNSELGVVHVKKTPLDKAIHHIDLDKFTDPHIQFSIRLQQEFGLRREESLKFKPHWSDQGEMIRLDKSWTKGGRGRNIVVRTEAQRTLLNELKKQYKRGESLIPKDRSYKKQLNIYTTLVRESGYNNLHGIRHAYAQRRYFELTTRFSGGNGWKAPIAGGKPPENYTDFEKRVDYNARMIVSDELGHARVSITKAYLGG